MLTEKGERKGPVLLVVAIMETTLSEGLRASEKTYTGLVKQIPLRRSGKTYEIVGAVLLLAAGASSYMTGSVVADGEYLAQ
jgi:NAD(P)-dependent dehydrogenase (short-subunit alcohol dehydrogenase family)